MMWKTISIAKKVKHINHPFAFVFEVFFFFFFLCCEKELFFFLFFEETKQNTKEENQDGDQE